MFFSDFPGFIPITILNTDGLFSPARKLSNIPSPEVFYRGISFFLDIIKRQII